MKEYSLIILKTFIDALFSSVVGIPGISKWAFWHLICDIDDGYSSVKTRDRKLSKYKNKTKFIHYTENDSVHGVFTMALWLTYIPPVALAQHLPLLLEYSALLPKVKPSDILVQKNVELFESNIDPLKKRVYSKNKI